MGLVFRRNAMRNTYDDVFISKNITDLNQFGSHGSTIAPLYLYTTTLGQETKTPNFKPEFLRMVNEKFNNPSPEAVLGYIYAVLHSPNYRTKYLEFLKIDFPRINFDVSLEEFKRLGTIGQELIDAHLMKKLPSSKIGEPEADGVQNFVMEKAIYNQEKQRLYFNKTCYFSDVSPEVWQFKIGGYQVLDKYLKSRKDMDISSDLNHIQNIIKVLGFTVRKIEEIDNIM